MKKKELLLSFLFYQFAYCVAQKAPCGAFIFDVKKSQSFDYQIDSFVKTSSSAMSREAIYIPVVVHILWRTNNEYVSDETVLSQIDALNRDFNAQNQDLKKVPVEFKSLIGNVGIHFCLAAKDTLGKPTTGILRKQITDSTLVLSEKVFYTKLGGSDAWNTEKYLNIWVVNTGKNLGGLASYPNQTVPEKTGVIIHPKYFGINDNLKYGMGRVATHEIGHFLGLKHTWADDDKCETDDNVEDTPLQKRAYFGCPSYPQKGCSESEMFMNFMDYVNDPCMIMFTEGQKKRMLATLQTVRKGLINSQSQCIIANNQGKFNQFVLFPNPTNGFLNISFKEAQQKQIEYSIFDTLGQLVVKNKLLVNQDFNFGFLDYPKGVYFIKIGNETVKFLKF